MLNDHCHRVSTHLKSINIIIIIIIIMTFRRNLLPASSGCWLGELCAPSPPPKFWYSSPKIKHILHCYDISHIYASVLTKIADFLMHNSFILQQYVCYTTIPNMLRAARRPSPGGQTESPQPPAPPPSDV